MCDFRLINYINRQFIMYILINDLLILYILLIISEISITLYAKNETEF